MGVSCLAHFLSPQISKDSLDDCISCQTQEQERSKTPVYFSSEWSIYTHLDSPLTDKTASIYNLNGKIITSSKPSRSCSDGGGLIEGRANGAEPDVAEDNAGVGAVSLNIGRNTRCSWASTTGDTRLAGISSSRVGRVEPEHVNRVVVPERHDKDVAASKRSTHSVQATKGSERRSVAESALLRLAEGVGNRVAADTGDGGLGVLVHLSVLDVEALDLGQAAARADELRDNGHLGLGVEGGAGAVEVLDAHAVAVEVAAILVAHALVAVVAVAAVSRGCASDETSALAGVGSVGGRDAVGLPDVHLGAASAGLAGSGVGVVG